MTPAERARMDAIHDSIEAMVKSRKVPRIDGISTPTPSNGSKVFFYAAIFALVLAAHVGGYLIYSRVSWPNPPAEPAIKPIAYEAPPIAPLPQWTPPPPAQPRISAPVYTSPQEQTVYVSQPQRVTQTVRQVYTPPPPPPKPAEPSKEQHAAVAQQYASRFFTTEYKKQIGATWVQVQVTVDETTYDPNWVLYRTTGKAYISYSNGNASLNREEKYEVCTQFKEGAIRLESDVRVK